MTTIPLPITPVGAAVEERHDSPDWVRISMASAYFCW